MRHLTRLALGHRTVTLLAVALVLAASIGAAFGLKQELFPSIQPPFLVVVASQPGAGPLSIVDEVTEPIEEAVDSTASLEQVQSTSQQGVSVVFAEYTYGTDIDQREREVRDALADADLPEGVETPEVTSITPDALPIYTIALTGDDLDQIADIAQNELGPDIDSLEGVADVTVAGAGDQVLQVTLDPAELAERGLTAADVAAAINAADLSTPVGAVTDGDTTLPVRVAGGQIDLDEIRALRVAPGGAAGAAAGAPADQAPGAPGAVPPDPAAPDPAAPSDEQAAATPVAPVDEAAGVEAAPVPAPRPPRISQLGDVETTRQDSETVSRLDGQEAVTIQVRKEQDANTVETVDRIESAIEDADLPGSVDADVVVDQAPEITRGVSDVTRDAVVGAFLALLMIIIFLRSWRGMIVAGISIPLSLIAALGLMRWTGITVNILTLGALAIAAGRVVDDAIVVLENIYRHLEAGVPLRDAVRRGASEVTGAVTSATLTAVAVFVPLAFISGLVGEVFIGFALTTTFALIMSLIVATTVVPVFGSLLLRRAEADKADPENFVDPGSTKHAADPLRRARTSPLRRMVRRPLTWALNHRALTVGVAVIALGGSIASLSQVPVNLFPTSEAENVVIEVEADQGTSLQATAETVQPLEERLDRTDGVDGYTTVIGSASDGIAAAFGGSGGDSTATITVAVEDGTDTGELRDQLSDELDDLGLTGSVVEQSPIPAGSDAIVQISGDDFAAVTDTAGEVEDRLASVDGLANLTSNVSEARPELTIDVREDDAREAGLDAGAVAGLLAGTLNTQTATSVDVGGDDRDVVVRIDPEAVDTADELRDLALPGGLVLGDVADVDEADSPAAITRADGMRSAEVTATITAQNIGAVTTELNTALDDVDVPDGVEVTQVGSNQEIGEGFGDLYVTQAIAVGLVYLILVATFGSLLTPFVIILTLPLAAIGAFPALAVTGRELGLPAMIGLLMLIGIVITNAIVLLEFVEQRRAAGMSVREALVDGAETRVRPILMTALTTIFGLVPLALGLSEGALLSASLATVVIGGLMTSTLLTLVVIPVVYSLLMGARERLMRERPTPATAGVDRATPGDEPVVAVAGDAARPRGRRAPAAASATDDLMTVGRFATERQAQAALTYLATSGMRVDRFAVRRGPASPRADRGRLTRLAAGWLRMHEPEMLTPEGVPSWELAAPTPFVAAARTVLAGNGQEFGANVRV